MHNVLGKEMTRAVELGYRALLRLEGSLGFV